MSEASEPRHKRQKCDGGEGTTPTTSSVVLDGPMYDEETARRMLRDAPVWPLGSGGEGEADYDPDGAALDTISYPPNSYEITPMLFFAHKRDVKMMRYLIFRGASTTKLVGSHTGPMHMAALEGSLDICKLLHANGAQGHVRLANTYGWTPFLAAAKKGYDQVVRWLVLHGALCHDDSSDEVNGDLINYKNYKTNMRRRVYKACKRLVDWSKGVLRTHSSMVTFLLGTIPPTAERDQGCILQCLSGNTGIRNLIGEFVGLEVTKAKQLRILRSLVEMLPETMRVGRKK